MTTPTPLDAALGYAALGWCVIPLHTIRHSRQIVEVKESDGYPEG